jgi:hypothetical protein
MPITKNVTCASVAIAHQGFKEDSAIVMLGYFQLEVANA